jgi:hypothetical protein
MNCQSAAGFINEHGNIIEIARLNFLLENRPAGRNVRQELFGLQRRDGGWAPFWAPDCSSLDATCFHLAQVEQLGISSDMPAVQYAVQFLAHRQNPDGSWEENQATASLAPPWAKPGSEPARLYLTANCGFWVQVFGKDHTVVSGAADYLERLQAADGSLPSFLQASWLAAGLWYMQGRFKPARKVIETLIARLDDMDCSNLAWMANTLLVAGIDPGEAVLHSAADRLDASQLADGHWASADGPDQDVHTTLEALRALRLLGR